MEHLVPERRHSLRYHLNRGVYFIYIQASFLVGKLTDISDTGLSFEYANPNERTAKRMTIDILSSKHEITQLTRLNCRCIYDRVGLVEKQSFKGTSIRQCGLAFEELSPGQILELSTLIEHSCGQDGEDVFCE